jgi:hypothetical protein
MSLLTASNAKIVKSQDVGYMTWILHLAPADLSGHEVCPKRSKGCTKACLNTAGRGKFSRVQSARIRKTKMLFNDRDQFMKELINDIYKFSNRAEKAGMIPCFRLNGTSDMPWEKIRYQNQNVFELFENIQFYDYTKILGRKVAQYKNYHLTFSLAEDNLSTALKAFDHGMNVAAVFERLPETFMGRPVFNGDVNDLRFLDPVNHFIGLVAKGSAKKDQSGFVIRKNMVDNVENISTIAA